MSTRRWVMPLKVATALTLSIVIALALGWNKPYWAAFAVIVMAATETNGHSLKKVVIESLVRLLVLLLLSF